MNGNRSLNPEGWSLFTAIFRRTLGWDKTEDTISVSQLEKMTGMKERRIQRNMKKLVKSGAPVRVVGTGKQGTRYAYGSIEPVTGDGFNQTEPVTGDGLTSEVGIQPVTGDGIIRSSPSLVTPPPVIEPVTGDGLIGSSPSLVTESPIITTVQPVTGDALESSPSPVTPTTDVLPANKRVRKDSLLVEGEEEGKQETGIPASLVPPNTSKEKIVEDDGLVEKTNSEEVDPASVSLVGSPTSKALFVNSKTGKVWEIGQDVACLTYELNITPGEAEVLLGYGKDAGQILAISRKSWESLYKANSRVAYLVGILKNKGKANKPATATSKPTPRSAAPPPMEKQAPAATGEVTSRTSWGREAVQQPAEDDCLDLGFLNDFAKDAEEEVPDIWPEPEPESAAIVATEPVDDPDDSDPEWDAQIEKHRASQADAMAHVSVYKTADDFPKAAVPPTKQEQRARVDRDMADFVAAAAQEPADVVEEPVAPPPAPEAPRKPAPGDTWYLDPSIVVRIRAVLTTEPMNGNQLAELAGCMVWAACGAAAELFRLDPVGIIRTTIDTRYHYALRKPAAEEEEENVWL
jgi:Bacteriophage replication protein O